MLLSQSLLTVTSVFAPAYCRGAKDFVCSASGLRGPGALHPGCRSPDSQGIEARMATTAQDRDLQQSGRVQPAPGGRIGLIVAASLATGFVAPVALVAIHPGEGQHLPSVGRFWPSCRSGSAPTPALGSCAGCVVCRSWSGVTTWVRRRAGMGSAGCDRRPCCLGCSEKPSEPTTHPCTG